jgi:hypothetical protein
MLLPFEFVCSKKQLVAGDLPETGPNSRTNWQVTSRTVFVINPLDMWSAR